tara:strand:- start:228 stop:383 length:156 start_codon:yes stop_codon:yes gene_type:complete
MNKKTIFGVLQSYTSIQSPETKSLDAYGQSTVFGNNPPAAFCPKTAALTWN